MSGAGATRASPNTLARFARWLDGMISPPRAPPSALQHASARSTRRARASGAGRQRQGVAHGCSTSNALGAPPPHARRGCEAACWRVAGELEVLCDAARAPRAPRGAAPTARAPPAARTKCGDVMGSGASPLALSY